MITSDNESKHELPDDKSTLGSNEKAKQNTHETTAPRKKGTKLQKEGREHIKRKY